FSPHRPLSIIFFFFFTAPSTTEISTLSLHDALPISQRVHFLGRHLVALAETFHGDADTFVLEHLKDPIPNSEFRILNWIFEMFKDRKSTRLNSSHVAISYAVFCLKKKKKNKKNKQNI